MAVITDNAAPTRGPSLALRYALREMRGGLSGFYVFIACIALGVLAIAGVGSVAASLSDGLAREGRTLLGGDVAFSLMQREAKPDEIAFLRQRGDVSVAASLRGMVRASDGNLALVEMKAVDAAYPLLGRLKLSPEIAVGDLLAERDGAFGAATDTTLLARLGLKLGDRVTVGSATFQIRSVVESEPDKLAGGVGFAPRFLISENALRATALLQPGSLVRWIYRIRLPDSSDRAATVLVDDARSQLPQAGWEIRSRDNASPQLERSITRFTQFLTLVGLAALLVGGVGVANAVKSHIDRRREVIAALKALGATGRDVFAMYLTQVMVLAVIGSLIGLALGAALPFAIVGLLGNLLPLPVVPALHPGALALSLLYGLLTALAFGLWPLARVHDVPVAALFRDAAHTESRRPQTRYLVWMALVVAVLVAVVIGLAYDKRVAAIFVVVSILVFGPLRGIAAMLRMTMLRLAIANIHRPGALTPSVVMSLGLGLTVLVTITQIDGNLQRQFMASLPEKAPSFYFIDIPSTEAERFGAFLKEKQPQSTVEEVPMLRGRIVGARGVKAEDLKPSTDAEWVLQSDRGISYTDEVPRGSSVVEGEWWPKNYSGPPLVSFEKKLADGLGLKLGDDVVVNVLGRDITAKIGSLRSVDWQSLGINFVLVFSPNTFRGAPHTHIAT
ncbi:MAG: FtsX-like permease family protein, partial [Hyphomicrobiales bacterium]|nr:FtsX-like permease family protein [Hyphomicrobiales bacterium]